MLRDRGKTSQIVSESAFLAAKCAAFCGLATLKLVEKVRRAARQFFCAAPTCPASPKLPTCPIVTCRGRAQDALVFGQGVDRIRPLRVDQRIAGDCPPVARRFFVRLFVQAASESQFMEDLLIVGIDSVVGGNLALALEDRFQVSGVAFDGPMSIDGIELVEAPRGDEASLQARLDRRPPRWIIYCPLMAASSWDLARPHQELPDETSIARRLAEWRRDHVVSLTVLVGDAMFAGPRMFHEEDSPATASGPWAEATRKLESALAGSAALIVRSHPYGWSPTEDSFLRTIVERGDRPPSGGARWSAACDAHSGQRFGGFSGPRP